MQQPPWKEIVRETLRANDPERWRELKRAGELEAFLGALAAKAERAFTWMLDEPWGGVLPKTWRRQAAEEIIRRDVILGEIPHSR